MQIALKRRFDAIERQRAALLESVLPLSDAQLNWTPNAAGWNIRQIVEHLVLCDETLGRARDPDAMETETWMFRLLPRALRRRLVLRALSRDIVLPLPSSGVDPQGKVALSELLSRWKTARGEMLRELETMREDEQRYSHPVLGPLTAAQMLELGETHTAYHARQLDAQQHATAFPGRAEAS